MAEQYQCRAYVVASSDPIQIEKCPVFGEDFEAFGGFCPVHRNGPVPLLPPPGPTPLSPFDTMANFNTAYDFAGKMGEMITYIIDMTGGMLGSAVPLDQYAPQGQNTTRPLMPAPTVHHPALPAPSPSYSQPSNLPAVQPQNPFAPVMLGANAGYPVQQMGWVSVDGNGTTMMSGMMTSVNVYYDQ